MTFRHTFKSAIASFFLSLVVVPALFLAPLSANTAYASGGSTPGGPLPTTRYSQITAKTMGCSWTSPSGCFAALVKTIFVGGGYLLFIVAGNVFDILVAVSLSSTMANNEALVNVGWQISRDIANTFFIFVLLYIAIMLILQLGGGQTKRMLATLIVVGLLINFSMYITKFIIDVGNVFALEFYNAIDGEPMPWFTVNGGVPAQSVTQGFADVLGNGTLTSQDFYDSLIKAQLGNGTMAFIFIMIGVMFFISTFVFFSAGFLFLSRLITFWICMIFSPLAVFSLVLPKLKSKIWDKWLDMLVQSSAFAPIFLFFVYLVMQLANNMGNGFFVTGNQSGAAMTVGNVIITLIVIALDFGAIIGLLIYALKLSQSMAGQIGASVSQIGSKVVPLGSAFGAAGWAGRKFIGGGAQYLSKNFGDRMETSDNPYYRKLGQYANAGLRGVASSSFDARNTQAVKNLGSTTGVALASGGGIGGYQKKYQEKQATITKRAEELLKEHPNNPEMAAKYLASQGKSFLDLTNKGEVLTPGAKSRGFRLNPDEYSQGAWKSFSVKDRQRMIESLKEGPEKEYLKTLNKGMAGKGNEEKEQFEMKMANAKVDANEKYKSFLALNTKLQPEAYKTMTAAQRTELREAEKAYIAETKGAVSKLDGIHEGLSPEEKERVIEADQKSAKIISERIAKDKLDAKKSALATADAIQAKLFLRGDGTAENKAMTANEIAKLPAETLIREEVAQHLGAAALTQAIESGNLTDEHVSTIVSTIVKNRETADRKVLETIAKGTKNLTLSTSEQRRLIQEALVSRDGAQAPAEESKIIIPPGSKTA